MKLNFLNALNGKVNHEEIAEQIVALEIKQKECENERNLSKILCKEVRGKTLCGEKISLDVIKNADKGYEEASLNLEIVTESLDELKRKLSESLMANCDDESKRLIEARRRLDQERDKAMCEFTKAKGRLFGMALSIYGYDERARINLECLRSFTPCNTDPFFEEFEYEKKKSLSEIKKPTVADIERDCEIKERWITTFNLDEEHAKILDKYRKKYASVAVEEQAVES